MRGSEILMEASKFAASLCHPASIRFNIHEMYATFCVRFLRRNKFSSESKHLSLISFALTLSFSLSLRPPSSYFSVTPSQFFFLFLSLCLSFSSLGTVDNLTLPYERRQFCLSICASLWSIKTLSVALPHWILSHTIRTVNRYTDMHICHVQ